ncbi:MAG TPA: hybrid sensor histidine kinase/response regulator [Spirochaetia bacterium]|nr:hybrid sensor histidine kinase/response regulator [Spirochaetia bacterium]
MDVRSIIMDMLKNFTLTLAPLFIAILLTEQIPEKLPHIKKVLLGIGLGCAAVLSAWAPLTISEGIILDFKHVLTGLSAFAAGPLGGAITAAFALIQRASLGGAGWLGGFTSIIGCGLIGLGLRTLFKKRLNINEYLGLLLLGLATAGMELAAGFTNLFVIPAALLFSLIRSYSIPILISNTGAVFFFGSLMTILESRRRYRDQLAESEQRYARFINLALDGIIGLNRHRIFFANSSAASLCGYDAHKLIGKKITSLVAPEDRTQLKDNIEQRLAKSDAISMFESRIVNASGVWVDVEFSIGVLRDALRSEVICFLRDISKRKRAEAEKNALADQLRQSQKMEAIGRLAGGVAHDFNNLLTVILGYANILRETRGEEAAAMPELAEIEQAASRAADMTRQLLAFSRKQMIKPIDLNLNEVIRSMKNMIERMIGEHIRLELIEDPSLGTVCADQSQIEQVIMNLCVNARDAMPDGGRLVIESGNAVIEEIDPETGNPRRAAYVELMVSDTGIGMDSETRSNIFEPFYTTKEQEKGTGLGLATVYGIVRQHGGKIHVFSEPGLGSSFKLFFPRVDRPAEELVPSTIPAAQGGHEHILVTEDDESVLKLVTRILEKAGYRVTPARDGREALTLFAAQGQRFDLALLDLIMPDLNGIEVMKEIRKIRPEMCFIFSSGYSFNILDNEELDPKRTDLIGKPYQPAELLAAVRRILDEKCRE